MIVLAMVGPSMCTFLIILYRPQTPEATRRELRGYLAGFHSEEELEGLGDEEQCALLLKRLRARGIRSTDSVGHLARAWRSRC